jgi:hypothetical protein
MSASSTRARRAALLRWTTAVTVGLLLFQLLVGMVANLFVEVPKAHPGTGDDVLGGALAGLAWALTSADRALAVHVLDGLLVGLLPILLLVVAVASRRWAWAVVAAVALLATLYAGLNGLAFMDAGKQDDNSLQMTLGFAVAVAAYTVGLVLPDPRPAN